MTDHKQTLLDLAKETGVTVTFFDGNNCVNGNDSSGSFICTACYCTLEENIIAVTNWIADLFYRNGGLQKQMIEINNDYEKAEIFYFNHGFQGYIEELEADWAYEEEQERVHRHPMAICDPYLDDCYVDFKKENTRLLS